MRKALQLASAVALAGILIPPILFFADAMTHDRVKAVMLLATVLWFAATPWWMNDRQSG